MHEIALARAVPVAPYTWGVAVDLPATSIESERIPIDINQPFELVGMHALVVRTYANGELAAPGVNDLLLRLESRHDTRLTTQVRRGENLPVGLAQAYVPLAAMTADVRLLGLEFTTPVADVSLQVRWAVDETQDPIHDTARVFLSLYVRPIQGGPG